MKQNNERNKMKCDQCGKIHLAEDTYIFDGQTYCLECGIPLLYALSDYGMLRLKFENCENDGVMVIT